MKMVLDLIHNFLGKTVSGVIILLFLELIIVLPCMIIMEKKDIPALAEGLENAFVDATITVEAKYFF